MSEWEDALNARVNTVAQTEQPGPTGILGALGGIGHAIGGLGAPYYPPPTYPPPAGQQRFGGNAVTDYPQVSNRCGRDNHYFECRHEQRCECGLTERLPLQLPEGL